MWKVGLGCFAFFTFLACGNDSGDPGPGTPSAGSAGTSGAGASGATSGGAGGSGASGGTAAGSGAFGGTAAGSGASGGTAAGSGASGGTAAGSGGSNAGSSGSSAGASGGLTTFPSGSVETCFGDSCPMGECDNGLFYADVPCSDVYPQPLGPTLPYCAPGGSGGYCLIVRTSVLERWSVACTDGVPQLMKCASGCAASADVSQCS